MGSLRIKNLGEAWEPSPVDQNRLRLVFLCFAGAGRARVERITERALPAPREFRPTSLTFVEFRHGTPAFCLEWASGDLRAAVLFNELNIVTNVVLYDSAKRVGKDVTIENRFVAAGRLWPGDPADLVKAMLDEPSRVLRPGDAGYDQRMRLVGDTLPPGSDPEESVITLWEYDDEPRSAMYLPVDQSSGTIGEWGFILWSGPEEESE